MQNTNTQYSAKLLAKKLIAPDVMELHFEKPFGFAFTAGQFIQLSVPHEGTTVLRSFSLSSSPSRDELEICTKLYPNGVASTFFQNMNPGELIGFTGPRGQFTFRVDAPAHIFVATGVGIAPIMSMISDEIKTKRTQKEIRLLFGVHSEEDMFWQDRLSNLQSLSPNFSYHVTLSQPKQGGGWSGLRGQVTDHLLHHLVGHEWYLCGGAAMVRDVRNQLVKNGVTSERIHFEIF